MSDTDDAPARVDVLRYGSGEEYRAVGAGYGEQVVRVHEEEVRKRRLLRYGVGALVVLAVLGYGLFVARQPLVGVVAAALVVGVFAYQVRTGDDQSPVPELVDRNLPVERAVDEYDLDRERISADPFASSREGRDGGDPAE